MRRGVSFTRRYFFLKDYVELEKAYGTSDIARIYSISDGTVTPNVAELLENVGSRSTGVA